MDASSGAGEVEARTWTVRAVVRDSAARWDEGHPAWHVVRVGDVPVPRGMVTFSVVLFVNAEGHLEDLWLEDYWEQTTL